MYTRKDGLFADVLADIRARSEDIRRRSDELDKTMADINQRLDDIRIRAQRHSQEIEDLRRRIFDYPYPSSLEGLRIEEKVVLINLTAACFVSDTLSLLAFVSFHAQKPAPFVGGLVFMLMAVLSYLGASPLRSRLRTIQEKILLKEVHDS